MYEIVSSEKMRRMEEECFASGAANSIELMEKAGRGCAVLLMKFLKTLPCIRRIVIISGHGNNGGDGMVMANILSEQQSLPVVLMLSSGPEKLSPSSAHFFDGIDKRVSVEDAQTAVFEQYDLIVDALLGTGCRAPMREPYRSLIRKINESGSPVFSVDLPSGLGAEFCVKADFTAVIGFFKDELFTPEGINNSGLLRLVELPILNDFFSGNSKIQAADKNYYQLTHKPLRRDVHKYQRGSVTIAGGSREYFQAPFLAARAALRGGAGIVRLCVPFAPAPGSGTLSIIPIQLPDEAGALGSKAFKKLPDHLKKSDVLALGPGMGRTPQAADFVESALTLDLPLVIDADAIVLAARFADLIKKRTLPTVFTPHRGEAKVLSAGLGVTLSGNDIEDARLLARTSGAVILLKGPRTVCAAADGRTVVNTSGTPALATAGSGDVLTGLLAANVAADPYGDILKAAARAAFLHGLSGELGSNLYGERGLTADDLPELAAKAACRLEKNSDIFE